MLAMALSRQLGHNVMSMSSHASDGATEATNIDHGVMSPPSHTGDSPCRSGGVDISTAIRHATGLLGELARSGGLDVSTAIRHATGLLGELARISPPGPHGKFPVGQIFLAEKHMRTNKHV
jgi:hypothetical protein